MGVGGKYRVCVSLPNGPEFCIWIPDLPANWPIAKVPKPEPDPWPWKFTMDGTSQRWAQDLSVLATIDSLIAEVDDQDLRQSLQEAVIRGREALQRGLPEGFRINVDDSDATSAEAY